MSKVILLLKRQEFGLLPLLCAPKESVMQISCNALKYGMKGLSFVVNKCLAGGGQQVYNITIL